MACRYAAIPNSEHADRPFDVFELLFASIIEGDVEFIAYMSVGIIGKADTARFCVSFETHCNIDPITKDIIVFDNNITDV
ncbi:MAG TPA: hypothetical protein VGO08_10900, partial [Burkholderiales bacterium]|nr:hypothetical protein [Burkholderiales bacterium]